MPRSVAKERRAAASRPRAPPRQPAAPGQLQAEPARARLVSAWAHWHLGRQVHRRPLRQAPAAQLALALGPADHAPRQPRLNAGSSSVQRVDDQLITVYNGCQELRGHHEVGTLHAASD